MRVFDKLFGKKQSDSTPKADEGDSEAKPLSLQVVFDDANSYTPAQLQMTLRSMSPALASVEIQSLEKATQRGTPVIRISWAEHVIDIAGLDVPFPKPHLENCVQPSHYGQDLKARVRANLAHALLFYSGDASATIEKYVALGVVAGAFSKHGASAVLNESAMTSLPASAVYDLATADLEFGALRHMPLLMLFCGFVKYFLPDGKNAWMRTYNNPAFGLPDFAAMGRIDQAKSTFNMFGDLMAYLLISGASFAPGHTAQLGSHKLKFRAPRDNEPFPTHTDGQLLIAEIIG